MHLLTIHIHQLKTDSASGEAERLGFVLKWRAHAVHGSWTIWTDPSPEARPEPGAFEVVTADDWRSFEADVSRAIQSGCPNGLATV